MGGKSILLIADPLYPVPPVTYGGAERIVDLLAESLAARGWDVTLACHPESTCNVTRLAHSCDRWDRNGRIANSWNLLKHLAGHRYDLIHSSAHFDLTATLWPLPQKIIQTFHAPPVWSAFLKRVRLIPRQNLWFTTVGHHMVPAFSGIAPTEGIHNAIRMEEFTFREQVPPDAPLVFLGRIERIKGTHTAIQIAKACNRRLVIAGNRSEHPEIDRYFKDEVEPHLNAEITYIGPVDSVRKNALLGEAAALLMPVEWDEPFGLVMAEALASGTPVIGLRRGGVPEIVNHGITGACCGSVEEMIHSVRRLDAFSRLACRDDAKARFSAPVMVNRYTSLYDRIISSGKPDQSS